MNTLLSFTIIYSSVHNVKYKIESKILNEEYDGARGRRNKKNCNTNVKEQYPRKPQDLMCDCLGNEWEIGTIV